MVRGGALPHQEGLPDYWGIETFQYLSGNDWIVVKYQEGLPDYWGIETYRQKHGSLLREHFRSGRITRLLGY